MLLRVSRRWIDGHLTTRVVAIGRGSAQGAMGLARFWERLADLAAVMADNNIVYVSETSKILWIKTACTHLDFLNKKCPVHIVSVQWTSSYLRVSWGSVIHNKKLRLPWHANATCENAEKPFKKVAQSSDDVSFLPYSVYTGTVTYEFYMF